MVADLQSERAEKYISLTDALYDKLVEAVALVDPKDTQGIRQITASVKDVKDMLGIKSEADMREQDARIRKLQKDAQEEESGPAEIKVVFGSDDGEDTIAWAE